MADADFLADHADLLLRRLSPADRARFLLTLPSSVRQQVDPSFASPSDLLDELAPPPQKVRHPSRRTPTFYRVRVDLADASPPIWRRLDLSSSLTLDQVHLVLQAAFTWCGGHLHQFSTGNRREWNAETFLTDLDIEEGDEGTPETQVRLDQVMTDVGDKLYYTYDFGDDWYHVIKLESTAPRSVDAPPARVLAGRRVSPPDDCGGIPGYDELLKAVSDPAHPDHAEMLDWLGLYGRGPKGYFDPAHINIEDLDTDVREALDS